MIPSSVVKNLPFSKYIAHYLQEFGVGRTTGTYTTFQLDSDEDARLREAGAEPLSAGLRVHRGLGGVAGVTFREEQVSTAPGPAVTGVSLPGAQTKQQSHQKDILR